jgi:hypothetical protein
LPTILALPAIFMANVAFSALGGGVATRAGTVVVLATYAFFGFSLLGRGNGPGGSVDRA